MRNFLKSSQGPLIKLQIFNLYFVRLLCPIICQVFAWTEFKFVFKVGETKYYEAAGFVFKIQNKI